MSINEVTGCFLKMLYFILMFKQGNHVKFTFPFVHHLTDLDALGPISHTETKHL